MLHINIANDANNGTKRDEMSKLGERILFCQMCSNNF